MSGAEFGGVDIDLLADYIGGALEGTPEESAVAARVADDPAWRQAYESLGGGMALVGAELGRLAPEPMPADLADRLDEMFRTAPPIADGGDASPEVDIADAAPIAGDLAAPPTPHLAAVRGPAASGGGAPGVREKQRKRTPGRRRMKWATPIAIAAGVVAFAGFSLDYLSGRSADDAQNSSAGSAADSGVTEQSLPASAITTFASGMNYTRETLAAEPIGVLDAPAPAAGNANEKDTASRAAAAKGSELARLVPAPALEACLAEIERANAGGVIAVRSVDYARFDGKPALVVRFSAANGQWAWASGPACGTPEGGAATLGNVPVR